MRIVAAEGEKNLAELAHRLFQIRGAGAKALEKLAVAALHDANPHLRPSTAIPSGTPVVIPEVEGLDRTSSAPSSFGLTENSVGQLRDAFKHLAITLETALEEELKDEEEAVAQLKQHEREFKAADQVIHDRLTKIKSASKVRLKELEKHKELQKLGLAQLAKDVDAFAKMLSP